MSQLFMFILLCILYVYSVNAVIVAKDFMVKSDPTSKIDGNIAQRERKIWPTYRTPLYTYESYQPHNSLANHNYKVNYLLQPIYTPAVEIVNSGSPQRLITHLKLPQYLGWDGSGASYQGPAISLQRSNRLKSLRLNSPNWQSSVIKVSALEPYWKSLNWQRPGLRSVNWNQSNSHYSSVRWPPVVQQKLLWQLSNKAVANSYTPGLLNSPNSNSIKPTHEEPELPNYRSSLVEPDIVYASKD